MQRLAFLILLLLCGTPLLAQTDSELDGWVKDLGSTEWRTREIAQRRLVSAADKAREKLQTALDDEDLEVSTRASQCLITIGESFSYAVTCAKSDKEGRKSHGRAALKNLFRIDDKSNLSRLSGNELQSRGRSRGSADTLPKDAAILLFEALSNMPIYVSSSGKAQWESVSGDTPLRMEYPGGVKEPGDALRSLSSMLQRQFGQKQQKTALVGVPLKIGRANFFYVVPGDQQREAIRNCANQLISDLLSDGPVQLRAAWLLAQSTAPDTEATANIRKEFKDNPEQTRLMWLALALGEDAQTSEAASQQDSGHALAAIGSSDWVAHRVASTFFRTLSPEKRSDLLCPVVAESTKVFELLTAIWNLWGCEISAKARARMVSFLSNTQQNALAGTVVHWFRKAKDISDAELDAIWSAAKSQTEAEFFTEALALFKRPDISKRMLDKARESLGGTPHAVQQSFAAAILYGHATQEDLELVLEKLAGAKNDRRLAKLQVVLFTGCEELSEKAIEKFTEHLRSTESKVRSVYIDALRRSDPKLRLKVAGKVIELIEEESKFLEAKPEDDEKVDVTKILDPAKTSQHLFEAWMIAKGMLYAAGDKEAMKAISAALESDNERAATTAAVALVEAVPADQIFKRLEELQDSEFLHKQAAVKMGYLAVCARAVYDEDSKRFRMASERAILAAGRDSWQIQNTLEQMRRSMSMNDSGIDKKEHANMPANPKIKELQVAN